ncbi:RluA family pseudouridine synthase [Undibacterium sp. RuRC25W]|uniref:RluA family pseudouridine synthase n=1 Tax=Undibacterium sp. RuRC25W TaxID=3413047 RepID=UPI003BEFD2FB
MSAAHLHHPPLPVRDGIAPSYIWLPEGQWINLISFLTSYFPDVGESIWLERMKKGEVVDQAGRLLSQDSAVKRGMCIFYYREIECETAIPFNAEILHRDEHLLVVDKPHFLPVTPGGRFLRETLLVRLKKQTGLQHLTPIHRLDRETAGVMLFSHNAATRGLYQTLFQQRVIKKIYHALAPTLPDRTFPLVHRSRMEEGGSFLVMQESEGEPNSETLVEVQANFGDLSLYRLTPLTGKKHQLRLHMTSLGAAILNDSFYPDVLPCKGDDFSAPLQLLAKSISFIDPISGDARHFSSQQELKRPDNAHRSVGGIR